jgi:hypothetical protein
MKTGSEFRAPTAVVCIVLGAIYMTMLTNAYVTARPTQELVGMIWWTLPFMAAFASLGIWLIAIALLDRIVHRSVPFKIFKILSGIAILTLLTLLYR